jgi:DNA-binding response OmpR family regulator
MRDKPVEYRVTGNLQAANVAQPLDSNGPSIAAPPVVLVVEDDETLRELIEDVLVGAGYVAQGVADGAAALAAVAHGGIDLVLLDRGIPEIDGLEVCRRVRATPSEDYLPIIMLTALATKSDRHAGFAAGADDYVVKPFDMADLLDRAQTWVGARRRLGMLHEQLRREQQALRDLERSQSDARLEGVRLAARELAHLLNNELAIAVTSVDLLLHRHDLGADVREQMDEVATFLDAAVRHVAQFQQVERVETKSTPVGPALDLRRSTLAPSD